MLPIEEKTRDYDPEFYDEFVEFCAQNDVSIVATTVRINGENKNGKHIFSVLSIKKRVFRCYENDGCIIDGVKKYPTKIDICFDRAFKNEIFDAISQRKDDACDDGLFSGVAVFTEKITARLHRVAKMLPNKEITFLTDKMRPSVAQRILDQDLTVMGDLLKFSHEEIAPWFDGCNKLDLASLKAAIGLVKKGVSKYCRREYDGVPPLDKVAYGSYQNVELNMFDRVRLDALYGDEADDLIELYSQYLHAGNAARSNHADGIVKMAEKEKSTPQQKKKPAPQYGKHPNWDEFRSLISFFDGEQYVVPDNVAQIERELFPEEKRAIKRIQEANPDLKIIERPAISFGDGVSPSFVIKEPSGQCVLVIATRLTSLVSAKVLYDRDYLMEYARQHGLGALVCAGDLTTYQDLKKHKVNQEFQDEMDKVFLNVHVMPWQMQKKIRIKTGASTMDIVAYAAQRNYTTSLMNYDMKKSKMRI